MFFDTLGVTYRYEVEGFELAPGLRYLPDFLLDTGAAMSKLGTDECWVEIKGKEPDALEERKAGLLAEQTDKPVFIFIRDVAAPSHDNYAYGYFP